jgi:hypothetical protein
VNAYANNSALMDNLIAQVPGLIHVETSWGFQSHEPSKPAAMFHKLGSAVIQSMVHALMHSALRDCTQ